MLSQSYYGLDKLKETNKDYDFYINQFFNLENEEKKFHYPIPQEALSHHPYLQLKTYVTESITTSTKTRDEFCRVIENGQISFKSDSFFRLKEIFHEDKKGNDDFRNAYLDYFIIKYGKDNINLFMQHYNQTLFNFYSYTVGLFLTPHEGKPFGMSNHPHHHYFTLRAEFTNNEIVLHCVLIVDKIQMFNGQDSDEYLKGILPEYIDNISDERYTYIKFPGRIDYKFRLDKNNPDNGFMFDRQSVKASNIVFAQLVDGSAAYDVDEHVANNTDYFANGAPVTNHAFTHATMINCANRQEQIRTANQHEIFYKMAANEYLISSKEYPVLEQIIGPFGSLGTAFNSYENAGEALMKRILQGDDVAKLILAVLNQEWPRPYLTSQQCIQLKQATLNALHKRTAESIAKCDALIGMWETDVNKYQNQLPELAEQTNEKRIVKNNIEIAQNKLAPTRLIKQALELTRLSDNLSFVVAKTNEAANIFVENMDVYKQERDSVARDLFYSLAILLCIPTAGITLFAALAYSYKATGSCLFFSENARTSSNIIRESLKAVGCRLG